MDKGKDRLAEREAMVSSQIELRGVKSKPVLAAMRAVPRHRFVPRQFEGAAYDDSPLPIGYNQTISQPYIVARMSEAASIEPSDRILEIGTGSGYQTAVLAQLAREVYTIEIVPQLASATASIFNELKLDNIHVRLADGYAGWPEAAPFDVIFVTAAPDHIPPPLIDQLKPGGRFVIPVGTSLQQLILVTKDEEGRLKKEPLLPVSFVPMIGQALKRFGKSDPI